MANPTYAIPVHVGTGEEGKKINDAVAAYVSKLGTNSSELARLALIYIIVNQIDLKTLQKTLENFKKA